MTTDHQEPKTAPSPRESQRSFAIRSSVNKALHLAHVLKEYPSADQDGYGREHLQRISTVLMDTKRKIDEMVRAERARFRDDLRPAPMALDLNVPGADRPEDPSTKIANAVAEHDAHLRAANPFKAGGPTPADVARMVSAAQPTQGKAVRR
ncbi:hypothetical protein [Brevibacterium sp.]|uniref:hypothetical protein n=1 Tax=Brevibacterium sp. TaxID=1701 RepID=UPI002811824D|nr:hypothetical protein [Brevibacterium sp.]